MAKKSKKSWHYADLSKSERLKRVLRFMPDGAQHSGRAIQRAAGVLNPGGAISELKRNGIKFHKTRYLMTDQKGNKIYIYQMA